MIATSIPVFQNQFLSTSTGKASKITSTPVPVTANKSVLSLLIINAVALSTNSVQLQGSYDGVAWDDLGSGLSGTSFGYSDEAVSSVDYAFLRVEAAITGTNAAMLFDANLTQTQQ